MLNVTDESSVKQVRKHVERDPLCSGHLQLHLKSAFYQFMPLLLKEPNQEITLSYQHEIVTSTKQITL